MSRHMQFYVNVSWEDRSRLDLLSFGPEPRSSGDVPKHSRDHVRPVAACSSCSSSGAWASLACGSSCGLAVFCKTTQLIACSVPFCTFRPGLRMVPKAPEPKAYMELAWHQAPSQWTMLHQVTLRSFCLVELVSQRLASGLLQMDRRRCTSLEMPM